MLAHATIVAAVTAAVVNRGKVNAKALPGIGAVAELPPDVRGR